MRIVQDNVVTWDCAVMLGALMSGFEIDFAKVRVLERHRPTIDLTTFKIELSMIKFDVDALLSLAETILGTTQERTRSFKHTTDDDEAQREMGLGASGSWGTSDCASTTIDGLTKGATRDYPAGFGKLDQPAS
ncbi:hypothetical protein MTR67_043584 [Solanum verrucosum]|uniref:Uncharacterized protein n=1 Tax=Solanum verrucosum TaxID=315347 RepID=A0AAF0UQJ5_SOLVR|nr:hypothetical protein MTR67_043584 [Solanum verrucosum]